MLDQNVSAQLKSYLERLEQPIELVASLDESETSAKMRELLSEIAELSDLVTTRFDGHHPRHPSFAVAKQGEPGRIHFAGLPMGHEFTSLILALLQTSGYPAKISDEQAELIKSLDVNASFEVFVSLTCHNCPDVVQALNTIAVLNPGVDVTMIDGSVFQDEVEQRQILAVPMLFNKGIHIGQGRMTLDEILGKLDTGADERIKQQLDAKAPYDVLVVGGGPAGATSALYAARKGIRVGVAAERFGGQVLDTVGIENYTSIIQTEGASFAKALEQHVLTYDVDLINLQQASAVYPADKTADGLVHVELKNGAVLKSKAIILSTGARWREMNVPGEAEYRTKGVTYCPHCDGPLFKGKRVAVIGGGNSGVEAAIDLAGIVSKVTLLEFDTKLRADEVLQRKLRSLDNVEILTNVLASEVLGENEKVSQLRYKERDSDVEKTIDLEGIFVQIGLLPNTEFLQDSVELSSRGEIVINDRGETSAKGVFAAGDVTTTPYKQIIIAAGAGATAALSAFDYLIRS